MQIPINDDLDEDVKMKDEIAGVKSRPGAAVSDTKRFGADAAGREAPHRNADILLLRPRSHAILYYFTLPILRID